MSDAQPKKPPRARLSPAPVDPATGRPDPARLQPHQQALRQAVVELVARVPTDVGQRVAQVASRVTGGALADVVASTFLTDPQRRFQVLCELDVGVRLEVVTEELFSLIGHLKPRKPDALMN